jgi:ribosomal protein S18 acetylase RimI-like enzyme
MQGLVEPLANPIGQPSQPISVRRLVKADLPAISVAHAAAFPDSALTMLGAECVRRYYEWQLLGPHEVLALGAFVDDSLYGFCFGGLFNGATAGFLSRNRFYLSWRVLTHPWLAANPMFRDRLTSGTRILKRFKMRGSPKSRVVEIRRAPKSFGILSIGVHPQCQGLGLGRLLMKESEEEARRRGFAAMDLTVHTNNQQAIRFYESLGWEKFYRNRSWQGHMTKQLLLNSQ